MNFLKNCLRRLSNLILKSGHFPGNWCEGIFPIYKCGNKIYYSAEECVSVVMWVNFLQLVAWRIANRTLLTGER